MDLRIAPLAGPLYHGPTQIARVLSEAWFAREGYCIGCLRRPVGQLAPNTVVADFRCGGCGEAFQLKARSAPFGSVVPDGAYSTFYQAVVNGSAPNLLLMHYDRERMEVVDLTAIHRKLVSPLSIVRRRPLGPNARRAGWVGCNLDLRSLPPGAMIPVVRSGAPRDEAGVRRQWLAYSSLEEREREPGWLRDTLTCIQQTGKAEFHLEDIYTYEADLSRLHPSNRNIRPKIRQQLQVLCRAGLVSRVRPGTYRRILERVR